MTDAIPTFLAELDLGAFSIESQTTYPDRRSLLRLQRLMSRRMPGYRYLEIGSYLGGTLTPYLMDPHCAQVISVDPRPTSQPDERGEDFPYDADTEAMMIAGLRGVLSADEMTKLTCLRYDIRDVDPSQYPKIDITLIDGEHTNVACFRDADEVLEFMAPTSIIIFHDSHLITDAIQNFELLLKRIDVSFATVFVEEAVAAIGLGELAEPLRCEFTDSKPRDAYFAAARQGRWRHIASVHAPVSMADPTASNKLAETLNRVSGERDELAREVDALRSSSSWRLTAPLRRAKFW